MPILSPAQLRRNVAPGVTMREMLDDPEAPIAGLAPLALEVMAARLATLARVLGDAELQVISAHRSIAVHARRGGTRRSLHLVGAAVDLRAQGVALGDLLRAARIVFAVARIVDDYVHVSLQPAVMRRWRRPQVF